MLLKAVLALLLFSVPLSLADDVPWLPNALAFTQDQLDHMYRWWSGFWELHVWTEADCQGESYSVIILTEGSSYCGNLDNAKSLMVERGGLCATYYYTGPNCTGTEVESLPPECGSVKWNDQTYTLTANPACWGWQDELTIGSYRVHCGFGGNKADAKGAPKGCKMGHGEWPYTKWD